MRKKIVCLLISLCFLVPLVPTPVLAAETSSSGASVSGYNTAAENVDGFIAPVDDPDASAIKITTAADLAAMANNMYGSYVLMNDIDMSGYGNWSPIGKTLSNAFHGKFDGQGHTISGLTVSVSFGSGTLLAPYYSVGLFGVCDGAQIKNIALKDVNISISTTSGYRYDNSIIDSAGTIFAGAIAGYINNNAVIYNCNVSGSISAKASGEGYSPSVAGGLVGYSNTSILSYCYNTASVESYNGNAVMAENAYAGGLLGRAESECIIDKSYNSGTVSSRTLDYGDSYAGGLVADTSASSAEVSNSFNEGSVQSLSGNLFSDSAYAGGIAAAFQGTIDKVYNSGTVVAQANDPYGISSTKAYAGGICGDSTADSTISNSAILQSTVSATASGTKYQYRISNSGIKSNNITVSSVTSGSTNDADIINSLDSMKTADVYVSSLGWDFTRIWEMIPGIDFPQLKQVDIFGEEYDHEYVEQHIDFIENGAYENILNNYRWAQIYWSEENNFKSNLGGALYSGVDKLVDLATLNFGALFEDGNPFKVMLADYISDQTVEEAVVQLYKVKVPYELDKKYKSVKSFIENNWKDAWGELSDEDLFWLFHYQDRTSEEWINSGFEEHIKEIVYETRTSGETLENVLGIATETLDTILEEKKHLDNTIDWFNGLITYSGHIAAYVQADEEFKTILEEMCNNLPASNATEIKYKSQLHLAIKSYTQYNDSEHLAARVFANYLADSEISNFEGTIKKAINSTITDWIKGTFSEAAFNKLNKIGWVADKTWKVCEYVTKNGELQECREMLKANAYFEDTMYYTLLSLESRFKTTQTFDNACLFDAAFKFFKETEICSMNTVVTYMDTYQTSWLQAIRNQSNTFMNSAIEEVQINKLFLYNTYCHGTSYSIGGKVITIACPTDVFIYDESGTLVVSVENDVVTYCAEHLLAYTADAVKMITVPTDQNYSIQIDATDDGTMSYSISEYNFKKENVQTTIYSEIAISAGNSFSGTVNSEIETDSETYNLRGTDDTHIDEFEVVTEDTNIPVQSIEIIDPTTILSVDDVVAFDTEIFPGNATIKSVAWSSSDPNVIMVSENGNLTALNEGTAIISAQSIYGGASDSVEVTVISDEHTLFITKHPQGATYALDEQAEALEVEWYEKNDEEITIQWYVADDEVSDGEAINGAVENSYVPKTNNVGIKYYYAEITDSFETRTSKRAAIEVVPERILDSGEVGDGVVWELTESLVLKIGGAGELSTSGTENLPWAQYQQAINTVEISEGITYLGANVLNDMEQLKKLTLPKSIIKIEEGALSGCNALVEIEIPFIGTDREEENTMNAVFGAIFGRVATGGVVQFYAISDNTLSGYRYNIPSTLRIVTVTDARQISFGAFYNCSNITNISINDGVADVGGYAFCNCTSLTAITIPDSVTEISEYALNGCNSLTEVSIPFVGANRDVSGTYDGAFGYIFGRTSSADIDYYIQYSILNDTSLSGYGYAVPTALRSIKVTDATQIPIGAFSNLTDLDSVTLNSEIIDIGAYSFYNCSGITGNMTIPEGVTSIGSCAFYGCSGLSGVTIFKSVTNIGGYAFGYDGDNAKNDGFTIYGYTDTAAETYANANSFKFVNLEPEVVLGDVDGDGVMTLADAIMVHKSTLYLTELTGQALKNADIDANGTVNLRDAILLQWLAVNQKLND